MPTIFFGLRRIRYKDANLFLSPTAERKAATKKKGLRRKSVERPKSRVALRATSLAVAVAQKGYFDPNVAPAQQRNS